MEKYLKESEAFFAAYEREHRKFLIVLSLFLRDNDWDGISKWEIPPDMYSKKKNFSLQYELCYFYNLNSTNRCAWLSASPITDADANDDDKAQETFYTQTYMRAAQYVCIDLEGESTSTSLLEWKNIKLIFKRWVKYWLYPFECNVNLVNLNESMWSNFKCVRIKSQDSEQ